jgi:hypothetical protein
MSDAAIDESGAGDGAKATSHPNASAESNSMASTPAAAVAASPSYERHFNRFEMKYVLNADQVDRLIGIISPYVTSDPHNGRDGFYPIVSLYYDSPDLMCFWEKVDGMKFRRKLRIRLYDENPDSAFLEIKQRTDQTTQKRRTRGNLQDLLQKMDLMHSPEFAIGEDPVFDESRLLVDKFRLEPKVIVSYNRTAWFGVYERGLRITVDRNLRYSKFMGRFDFRSGRDRFFVAPGQMVLEVKFNEVVPGWLCTALNCLDLAARRVSKYCYAINHGEFGNTVF